MALSAPRSIFGIHSFTPISRTTWEPYGIVKVLKSSTLAISGETIELTGGTSKYSWHAESGPLSAEMSLKFAEFPSFLFTLFLGITPTDNAAESGGSVTTLTNRYGTTAKSATIGVASVGVKSGSETDVKWGFYLVKVVGATTVDVYYMSDADMSRGTNGTYQNDLLKITASPLTISTGAAVTMPNFGMELTGGSGTIGMTIGHTASFTARPINTLSTDVVVGAASNQTPSEFGALVVAAKRGNAEMGEFFIYRCLANGMPFGLDQNAWSESEVKVKVLYDSSLDGVFEFHHVTATGL